jgi:two-component system chemotaxis sensor kinase CheA
MSKISKYIQIFKTDSLKALGEMNSLLFQFEKDLKNKELLNDLFRNVHSLKGMSSSMGYNHLIELTHAMEEPLSKLREGQLEPTKEMVDLLFKGVNFLENLIEKAVTESAPRKDYKNFIKRLQELASSKITSQAKGEPVIKYRPPKAIPIETEELDNLINIVGEMVSHRNQLIELNRPFFSHDYYEGMQILEKLIRELYQQVLKIRMMPIYTITDLLRRIVRDLASSQDKEIDLDVEGDKTIKLDRTVLEALMDPLIHLIRNAVDHGIESPSIRRENGKPRGKIVLRFSKEGDMVKLELSDDGKGIDLVMVKDRALRKGIINKEVSNSMSEEDTLMLLCIPGLSTSKSVTDISGRGVGLDVVKSGVEALNGSMHIQSVPGMGSKITLKIPTTIHIIFALFIRLDSQIFAIPIYKILASREIEYSKAQNTYTFQNSQISLTHLADLLKIDELPKKNGGHYPLLIVEIGGNKFGLMVDELVGIEQIFVKPLGRPLNKIECLNGVTILGDGRMALILDLERLR